MLNLVIDRFSPGSIVITRGVNSRIADDINFTKFVLKSIRRHLKCDWGDLCLEDKECNDLALSDKEYPERLFAAYEFNGKTDRIYIITEWDRSYTTIMFPDEY